MQTIDHENSEVASFWASMHTDFDNMITEQQSVSTYDHHVVSVSHSWLDTLQQLGISQV